MKRLAAMVCLVIFITGCTNPGITEDHETDIQLINKKKIETPTTKNDKSN